eukprot:TRINITY_DN37389_c0_g1_i2.p1 TRINITY_DN37389_c0_g1~~TRINITY_DN37389_c0_g1_i2.p1  ORF type:complete len:724 (+),score=119.77 TRINITY_DN37389_c0_g1_i2:261-2174(+)
MLTGSLRGSQDASSGNRPSTVLFIVCLVASLVVGIACGMAMVCKIPALRRRIRRIEHGRTFAGVSSLAGSIALPCVEDITQSDAAWLDRLVSEMWPNLKVYITARVTDSVKQALLTNVPAMMKNNITLKRCQLRGVSPRLGPIGVRRRNDNAIVVELGIDADFSLELDISAMGVLIGLDRLALRGLLTIVLLHPTAQSPFFRAMEMYFINAPDIFVSFIGVASVPGIHGVIRSAMMSAVQDAIVLPARIGVDLNDEDDLDMADIRFPHFLGVVRLTVKSANNLPLTDTSVFGTPLPPDPYVIVQFGKTVWKSPCIQKTASPVWDTDNEIYLPVYDPAQCARFTVYDQDVGKQDDLCGIAQGVCIEQFMRTPGFEELETVLHLLRKSQDENATLVIATQWLVLVAVNPNFASAARTSTAGTLMSSATSTRSEASPVAAQDSLSGVTVTGPPQLIFVAAKVVAAWGLMRHGLRPPFTVRLSVCSTKVGLEATTGASARKMGRRVASEHLKDVCKRLQERGFSTDAISSVTQLDMGQVQEALDPNHGQEEFDDHGRLVQDSPGVPEWNQVVHLLVDPEHENEADVSLELISKDGSRMGKLYSTPLKNIIAEPGGDLNGPFDLGDGITLQACLRARYLSHA